MAASALIKLVTNRVACSVGMLMLVAMALTASPAEAQWIALSAPGQATRSVASGPTVLAIASGARILAIGHDKSKSITFYHPDTAVLLGITKLPEEPVGLVLSDDGNRAYALYKSSGIKIAVINTATRAIANTWSTSGNPVGMVLNGSELLVADDKDDRLVGISTTTGAVTRTKIINKKLQMIGIGASSALILVGLESGELQLLDTSTLAVNRTVKLGDNIRSLAWWDGGGGRVLALDKSHHALSLVDPATGTITRVALGGDPDTVGIEQHNNWAYVGEKDDQIISLIDLIDRALSGYFTIPGKIGSILFDQQGGLLFVALTKDDKILKLDPNQASLISKVGVVRNVKDVAVNSVSHEGITISDSDYGFARINLVNHAVQTEVLPVKADNVVIDAGLNVAIVGADNDRLLFFNLATSPATLYPQQVDLDGAIKDMAVDPVRSITVAIVSGKQRIRVINNVTRAEIAAVTTADKYVAVAIHSGKGIAYLATDDKKLSLFSLTDRTVIQTINLSFEVEGIAVDPTLSRAVLTTKNQDKAWILNLDTLQMVTSFKMAKSPGAVAIQTDTHIAVVASKDDDTVSLIDLNTNSTTLNFNRIDKPTGLAISNRFNKLLVVSSDKNELAIVQLSNPPATLTAITPMQVTVGAGATLLTLTGAHFIDGAIVHFGATPLTTIWVSSGTLTATIPAALLTTAGTHNVRLQNPAPAGGSSAALVFTVGTLALPGPPTIGIVTPGNAQATVSFVTPASDGGAAITSYTATSNPGAITSSGSASPIVVTGLVNGSAYTFTVTATNANGTGAASAASTSVTPATLPGAPIIGTASAGNTQATVAFTPPLSHGGTAITGYTVTANPGGLVGTGVASPVLMTGLTNGTGYTFTVTATNAIGTSASSFASNSVTPASVPGAPNIVSATAANASAAITFIAPASNGGSVITGYSVTSTPGGLTSAGTTSPIIVNGLTNGTAYTFTVTATNAIGTGAASASSSSVTPATVPGAPTIGLASAGNAQVTISFTAPAANGGSVISSYIASCGGQSNSAISSPITVTGLPNGSAVTCVVRAINAIGNGPASAASNSVTPNLGIPGAPTIGTATTANASASVTFTPPVSDGGSPVISYTATATPGNVAGTCSAPCTVITVSGLVNGTTYTLRVQATNSNGTGAASAPSNSVTPSTVPGTPSIGTATAGNGLVTVSFTPPASNGGSAITGYTATCAGQSNTGAATPITVSGLTNGIAVTCMVTARNAIGTGAPSAASNSATPTLPVTVPGAPTIGVATAGNASAIVTFAVPGNNGGSAITSYSATSAPGGLTGTCTAPCTSINVSGLTNNTAYTFSVRAINAIGSGTASAASNSITPNVPATVPGAPTIGIASAGNASATIAFIAPASNGGSAITIYTATSTPGGVSGNCNAPCTSIVVTGLSNGTAVTFRVSATNAAGSGALSAASNAVTPTVGATVPDAPTIGVATSAANSATVTFTPSVSNGGSAITTYTATSAPGNISGSCNAPCTAIAVAGLANGTTYTMTVRANNAVGASANSAASNSVTPSSGVPGAPLIGTATAGNTQATVTFTPPVNTGGAAIATYIASSTPGTITGSCTAPCTAITVAGLTNGTAYTFRVRATSASGSGANSAASNSVTPGIVLQTITGFRPASPVRYAPGAIFTLSASGGASGNPVVFGSAATAVCSVAGNIGTIVATGACVLTADQAAGNGYAAAQRVLATVVVEPSSASATLPRLLTSSLANAVNGQPYEAIIIVSASSPLSGISINGLPAGISAAVNANGNIALSGSPSAAGNFILLINATSAGGSTTLSLPLLVAPFVNTVVSLAAGSEHDCAVYSGGIRCWGNNSSGQLGNNSTIATLDAVVAVPAGTGATQVSGGRGHTCAVISGGVQCWGANDSGQLGNGGTVPSPVPVVAITAGSNATVVAAGRQHSCAVVNGGVRCWGRNAEGQLGNNSTLASSLAVIALADGSSATAIAAGVDHTCAVVNGGVQCWGSNNNRSLGAAAAIVQSSVPLTTIAAGSNATAISAGDSNFGGSHTCALVASGVQCWGDNTDGKLGGFGNTTAIRSAIDAGSNVTGIAAGARHTCAAINGGVKCWGNNNSGQLGDGTQLTSIFSGVVIDAITAGSGVTGVAVGGVHSCALINGAARCWGFLNNVPFGYDLRYRFSRPVVAYPAGSQVTSLAAGNHNTCAVVNAGLNCVGTRYDGGMANSTPAAQFLQSEIVTTSGVGNVHLCAVVDGGALCRGSNANGQFGNNSTQPLNQPASVPAASQIGATAAGDGHTCAVVDGGVSCWGGNWAGQLGNNSTTQSLVPVVAIATGSAAAAVSARSTHTCALVNGGIKCWGQNNNGQLGNNSTIDSPVPIGIFVAGSNAIAIATGAQHTCAVVNGGVQCWGANNSGQLGNNSTALSLNPVTAIGAGSNATAVAAGTSHTCAVVDGGVQCWGNNSDGQLGNGIDGNGNALTSLIPVVAIPAGSNVTTVTVGSSHSCAMVNGGALCWGSNASGQLANPATNSIRKAFVALTDFQPPGAPTITGTSVDANSITLSFTPPASDGGSAITGYAATCTQAGSFTRTGTAPANATAITVTGLVTNINYTCNMTAATIAGSGPVSNTVSATPVAVIQPGISITTPANNATIALGIITIGVTAQAGSGNLSTLAIFAGATLLTSITTPAVNAFTFSYDWSGMAQGSHTLTATVTTTQGLTRTSAPITVQVLAAPAITLSTLSNFALAGSTVDLNATATPAGSATITKVEFFASNGSGNTLIGTITTAPYNFRWTNVAAGNYTITARATDSQGLTVISSPRSISVSAAPPANLTISSPANQANMSADSIIVTGTYQAVMNAGIVVNGVLATLDGVGNFLAEIPLTQGSNTITATLTAPTGETATSTVMVTATIATLPVTVAADKSNGPAPLDVVFTITNTGDVPLNYTMNGGQSFALGAGVTATLPASYTQPGAFVSSFAITDGMGNNTTKNLLVEVRDDVVTDQKLRAVWNGMGDKLRAGDVNGALAFITGGAVDQYAILFNALKLEGKLADAVNALGSLRGSTVGSDIAELIISRETASGTVAYPVWLLRGPDGVWRIESM